MNKPDNTDLESWAHALFLEKITLTAPNIIYIFNQQTQSNEYVNRSIGESLGYTTKEIQEMGDALFLNLCHPDDLPIVSDHLGHIRQMADGDVANIEYRMQHKTGDWRWLLGYDTVFERNENGEVIRHLGVATDITPQKLAQEQALTERRAADTINQELQAFAYSMSHDMKAPSKTLHLLLSELKEQHGESLDDDGQELLNMSLSTITRMQSLVENVLSYTQVIGQEIEFETVDLNDILTEVTQNLLADTSKSGAQIRFEKLPVVQGSRLLLGILFQNLVANAIKYQASDSRPLVTISCTLLPHDKFLLVHVKDNGIGIAPQHQYRIFDIFKRLHSHDEYSGTGLGLAICNRIALRHGAELTVDSTVGKGSTFTVVFRQQSLP